MFRCSSESLSFLAFSSSTVEGLALPRFTEIRNVISCLPRGTWKIQSASRGWKKNSSVGQRTATRTFLSALSNKAIFSCFSFACVYLSENVTGKLFFASAALNIRELVKSQRLWETDSRLLGESLGREARAEWIWTDGWRAGDVGINGASMKLHGWFRQWCRKSNHVEYELQAFQVNVELNDKNPSENCIEAKVKLTTRQPGVSFTEQHVEFTALRPS